MPPILAFSGFSQSGKTTLLAQVVAELSGQGFRLGVVKHHGHGSREEVHPQGKDSRLLLEAGATAVALTGPGFEARYRPQPGDPGPEVAAAGLGEVDLVLAEGFKSWPGFKIEVLAPGQAPGLLADPWLLALAGPAGDRPAGRNIRFFDRDEATPVADFIATCFLSPGRRGRIPDREECFALMARYRMLPNIIVHSLMVAEVSAWVAAGLVRAGHDLDLPLTVAGGLLHDIAKTECLGDRCLHAQRGAELAAGLGLPGVAEVVADHIDPAAVRARAGLASPSLAVNYADKRVLHDQVVSLDERAEYLLDHYGTTPERHERIRLMVAASREIEAELFARLDFRPEDLLSINRLTAGVN